MFGQLLEPRPGAVDECGAVVGALPVVEVDDVAALAIAAPPPAIAPVTANVTRSGFSRTVISFASNRANHPPRRCEVRKNISGI